MCGFPNSITLICSFLLKVTHTSQSPRREKHLHFLKLIRWSTMGLKSHLSCIAPAHAGIGLTKKPNPTVCATLIRKSMHFWSSMQTMTISYFSSNPQMFMIPLCYLDLYLELYYMEKVIEELKYKNMLLTFCFIMYISKTLSYMQYGFI